MFDSILPLVKKPIRYTGGEHNITVKRNPTIRIGVVFPEIYEIGMSNLGMKIIYHLFNQTPDIQCERIFAPWYDFGEQLKEKKIPLYGLETKKSAKEFDLLGFSLQSEMSYTNVLYMLDLAHIPPLSTDRDSRYPIIIAGGPAVLNPRPLSTIFDAFVIGDGEEIANNCVSILKNIPKEHRDKRIKEMAKLPGVWCPNIDGYESTIKKSVVASLGSQTIPSPPLLPIGEITHDRYAIEIMRGCTWGCRFCQAGYVNRPVRTRDQEDIQKSIDQAIRETGWEEVSLLSFSILDYPDLLNLIRKLNSTLKKKMVNVSLPAMRGELFNEDLALLLKEIKKTGLTFAPETGSERLRYRLNKAFPNDKLISSINAAHRLGWKQVKLYFMIGLPFETNDDIKEIDKLVSEILKAYPKGGVKLAINPFIPKPHTPFQDCEFASLEDLYEKIALIRKMSKRRVDVRYQSPEVSYIEAILSRADEKVYSVIQEVYSQGGIFEEWREGFKFERWQNAFEKTGIDPHQYVSKNDHYPWDFVDIGVTKDFLKKEYQRAVDSTTTANCLYKGCSGCGACSGDVATINRAKSEEQYIDYGRYSKRKLISHAYRVKYSIGESFRYASHRDMTRSIYRALRRSELPLQFSKGFSPIPKVSFGPPKSVGQIAKGDYFDFTLATEYFGDIAGELTKVFPAGIRILDIKLIPKNTSSLSSSINLIYYEVEIPRDEIKKPIEIPAQTVYIKTRSGMKVLNESLESISFKDGFLTCALLFGGKKINIYELLSYLTGLSVEESKLFKVTRTTLFIKTNGILYTPMEVR